MVSISRTFAPNRAIANAIVDCLDAFADASKGRYANYAALGDPNLGQHKPIEKCWCDVAGLIFSEHYVGRPIQERVEHRAREISAVLSSASLVLYTDKPGRRIQDLRTASVRTGQTEMGQRYGRYHALAIVRWLADSYSAIARLACSGHRIHAFLGSSKHFHTYMVPDDVLRRRKTWPIG